MLPEILSDAINRYNSIRPLGLDDLTEKPKVQAVYVEQISCEKCFRLVVKYVTLN